ncbi:MAG: hypothetical protein E7096_09210 [Bacteroides sp.]|nr:hypothetical protein [Bacteroides sp.]
MKKFVLLLVTLVSFSFTSMADDDKPIRVSEMPRQAQKFIETHFKGQTVALAKMETDFMSKSYDVIFTNGDKLEFDKKGHWTKVDCEHSQVPTAVLPVAIQKYIGQHYGRSKVKQIELTDRKGYEVELSNGVELKFNKKFQVIDIDR